MLARLSGLTCIICITYVVAQNMDDHIAEIAVFCLRKSVNFFG